MYSEKIAKWKQITVGFAIFGFFLSFIAGLFGRVSFGVLIMRAFLFAALFTGIALLIMKLLEMFVPELFLESDDDSDMDESLDIEEEASSAVKVDLNGQNLDITIEDEDSDVEDSNLEQAQDLEELDVVENPQYSAPGSNGSVGSQDIKDEPEELSGEEGLPDISAYSDSFEAVDMAGNSDGLSSIDGLGGSSSAEILGGMHETTEIVKAVKTVLKKDQEG